jgi:hypothetical protein
MIFWCGFGSGSGSADPCVWLVDPDADPDPAFFVIDLQDANKNIISFSAFCRYICIIFQRQKVKKKSQSSRNQGFSYIFYWWQKDPDPYLWLMDPDPEGPKTYGLIRIQIRNTAWYWFKVWTIIRYSLITLWSYIYIIFSQIKSHRSHKTIEIKSFLLFLLSRGIFFLLRFSCKRTVLPMSVYDKRLFLHYFYAAGKSYHFENFVATLNNF